VGIPPVNLRRTFRKRAQRQRYDQTTTGDDDTPEVFVVTLATFGSASRDLNDGMPGEMASDRADMSTEVLREHDNAQTEEDKRGLQREFLDNM